ncbi:MAG: hypothetical protein KAQ92_05340 [Candidatus Aenigmarchaeota archaeon]|nr:hypothetical protein [Candidatus Aenigmarchaeota archaeon]
MLSILEIKTEKNIKSRKIRELMMKFEIFLLLVLFGIMGYVTRYFMIYEHTYRVAFSILTIFLFALSWYEIRYMGKYIKYTKYLSEKNWI